MANTMVYSKMIKNKVKESSDGQMANSILVNGDKAKDMEQVCGRLLKAIVIWVNGRKVLFRVKEYINH